LCDLQNKDNLSSILEMMCNFRNSKQNYKPFVLKISPDLNNEQIIETLELVKQYKIEGIVVANTTTKRYGLSVSTEKIEKIGNGGLSGKPIFENTVEMIKNIRKIAGNELTIIGSGGVFNKKDAIEMYSAGANLIQVYTGFIYEGVILPKKLARV